MRVTSHSKETLLRNGIKGNIIRNLTGFQGIQGPWVPAGAAGLVLRPAGPVRPRAVGSGQASQRQARRRDSSAVSTCFLPLCLSPAVTRDLFHKNACTTSCTSAGHKLQILPQLILSFGKKNCCVVM